jgi:hypothetical protein
MVPAHNVSHVSKLVKSHLRKQFQFPMTFGTVKRSIKQSPALQEIEKLLFELLPNLPKTHG